MLLIVFQVKATPGVTLREGLAKSMHRRQLDPDKCHVFRHNTRYVCDSLYSPLTLSFTAGHTSLLFLKGYW